MKYLKKLKKATKTHRCDWSYSCRKSVRYWYREKDWYYCKIHGPKFERFNYKKYGPKKTKKERLEWKERVFAGWVDTPEQAAFRRSPEYQQWRITVLERDKYTCQHCSQTGGKLVVHHIKTFKMFPELRLEHDNGIVLCNNCHEELHLSRVKQPKILKYRA